MKLYLIILLIIVFVVALCCKNRNEDKEHFTNRRRAISASDVPKNKNTNVEPKEVGVKSISSKCKGPPQCKSGAFKRSTNKCKSGCGTKIPKLGYICCQKGCCNKKSLETDTVKTVKTQTQSNIKELKKIGSVIDTDNTVPKSDKDIKSVNEITKSDLSELKKQLLNQDKKIKRLDARVSQNDKNLASVNNRDSELLEANDGVRPINPSSFSFKPDIKFSHKEPSRKIASSYGWSFMPPNYWSVPQKRPPSCIPSKKNTATVTPIYDKSVPVDVLDYTQVGSILPKFDYKEVHNPNYYYPGWIAGKEEPYPGKNGKNVMKTGEYYNMKLARPTGLEPKKAIHFGKKIIDDNIHPQKVIRKSLKRR